MMSIYDRIASAGPTVYNNIRSGIYQRPAEVRAGKVADLQLKLNTAKVKDYIATAPSRKLAQTAADTTNQAVINRNQNAVDYAKWVPTQDTSKPLQFIKNARQAGFSTQADALETKYLSREVKIASMSKDRQIALNKASENIRSFLGGNVPVDPQQYDQIRQQVPQFGLPKIDPSAPDIVRRHALQFWGGSYTGKSMGSSEFERNVNNAYQSGRISQKKYLTLLKKRRNVLAGIEGRLPSEQRINLATDKNKQKKLEYYKKEASTGLKHFNTMDQTISDALAELDSGNTAVSDKLLAQTLSEVGNTKIRAVQMFKIFDTSYGNVAGRAVNSIERFLQGHRTEDDKNAIRETLTTLRNDHVIPGLQKLKNQYRKEAGIAGVDPFQVVYPTSKNEIRDNPWMKRKQKLEYLKKYFPGDFQ